VENLLAKYSLVVLIFSSSERFWLSLKLNVHFFLSSSRLSNVKVFGFSFVINNYQKDKQKEQKDKPLENEKSKEISSTFSIHEDVCDFIHILGTKQLICDNANSAKAEYFIVEILWWNWF